MDRICFVGSGISFIEQDRKLLESLGYDVDQHSFEGNLLSYFLSYRREIKRAVQDADILFGWFASWETMAAVYYAKRYGKKSIVVTGGYDVVCMPDIKYGAFTNSKEKISAKYVLNNADLLLPFSYHSKEELLLRSNPNAIKVVYIGVDSHKFKWKKNKQNIAITVGGVNQSNLKRKGIKYFVKAANHLPEVPFFVIGKCSDDAVDYLAGLASDNVTFTGFVSDVELLEWYQKSKVYTQVSAHEGFGLAMAEAMLCGNVPVVTRRGAIPEVVGDTGIYVKYADEKATAKAIKVALESSDRIRKDARKRIEAHFSIEKRENKLKEVMDTVLKGR